MEILLGAAIFGVGTFFGAWFFAAGQQLRSNRTSQKIQDAILKSLEYRKSNSELQQNTPAPSNRASPGVSANVREGKY